MSDEIHAQQLTVREERANITAGGSVAGLVPQNIEQAYRLANAMHISGLAPSSLGSAEKVLVAIMAGAELGLPPFQAVQSFAVINNRPTIWGDGMLAVVRSHGCAVREWAEGEDDARVAWCEVKRPDTGEVVTRDFSVLDAKKAKLWEKSGPWQTNPKRMLQMRARAFALRDACADILRGFQMREEVEDYQVIRDARPQVSDLRERLEAQGERSTEGFTAENGEHETPEEVLAEVELPIADTQRPQETAAAQTAEPAAEPPASSRSPKPSDTLTTATTAEPDGGATTASPSDDDSDAEGLEGPSEQQLVLDREYAETMRETALPLETAAKPAASALGGQSAPSATPDASPEPQAAPGPSPAPADDPVVAFCNSVGNCATWAEGKIALGALTKAHQLEPHEMRAARLALWNIPARGKDKVDPGADPTAFMCFLEAAPEEDQIDGTLQVLDRSDAWQRLNVAQQGKIKDAAAAAKRRLADKAAAE